MPDQVPESVRQALKKLKLSPFAARAADALAVAVLRAVLMGRIETRTEASDALESYLNNRFHVSDGSGVAKLTELLTQEELGYREQIRQRGEKLEDEPPAEERTIVDGARELAEAGVGITTGPENERIVFVPELEEGKLYIAVTVNGVPQGSISLGPLGIGSLRLYSAVYDAIFNPPAS